MTGLPCHGGEDSGLCRGAGRACGRVWWDDRLANCYPNVRWGRTASRVRTLRAPGPRKPIILRRSACRDALALFFSARSRGFTWTVSVAARRMGTPDFGEIASADAISPISRRDWMLVFGPRVSVGTVLVILLKTSIRRRRLGAVSLPAQRTKLTAPPFASPPRAPVGTTPGLHTLLINTASFGLVRAIDPRRDR
jgi:hypothetical protein